MSKKIFFLTTILVLFTLGTSKNKKLLNVKRIGILSINMNIRAMNKKKDLIVFPNILFINKFFKRNIINSFNSVSQSNIVLSDFSLVKDVEFPEEKEIFKYMKTDFQKQIYFPFNFKESIPIKYLKILMDKNTYGYYIVLDINQSVWSQKINVQLKLFSNDKKLILKKKFNINSKYIIKDKNSSYLTDYENIIDNIDNNSNHKKEIEKIFQELSKKLGKKIFSFF